ncbi:galactose-1-phosphate uridylyltransferase [Acidiferrimicrobium sp. IK]|uniref:galactose-1-phosphate uridylyltransferase n=1 Tax=Acidiferrimicrobium sp. IK TaxID=2871700 RepID=UPI0021CB0040|nr:galactose-1-phosphate uridylyltransferase [Acidiferrimicrobium sp. IK]MCU4182882.1 galactose-1-phosphate uridylyltransferase [Acidiferrimicrobium sp. IK]
MTERRYDPTTGEWVVVSTNRQDRTYLPGGLPDGAACPLCPTRPGGPVTEIPRSRFEMAVFDNRFPALTRDPPRPSVPGSALTPVAPAAGACEVVVYSDDHDASLASLGAPRARTLVEVWAARTAALRERPEVAYVMPFENRGAEVGVTLSHPHGQIYAYPDIPPRPALELRTARRHHQKHGSCVWCDLVAQEAGGPRQVAAGGEWLAVVPFWARFPYQVELWPRRHATDVVDLTPTERAGLARLLVEVLEAYDRLWDFPLPYVMALHQRPTDGGDWETVSHLHVELSPPHRSATKLKHLAGSELAGGAFLTDVAPEDAAAQLRAARHR